MTNTTPRRDGVVRAWLLSVIALVGVGTVAGSIMLWHAHMGELLGLAADKAPVVSTASAPAFAVPPPPTTLFSTPPSASSTHAPVTHAPPTTPSRPPKATPATKKPKVDEGLNALSGKLKSRLRKAMAAARADGITIRITHAQGKAVDVGPAAAMTWLEQNGWQYGVCRRYDNEPSHFEALTAPGKKCPPREPHAVAKADRSHPKGSSR